MVPRLGQGEMAELIRRVLSALVLAPLVLAGVYVGGWVFLTLVGLAALISGREWERMVAPRVSAEFGASSAPVVTALSLTAMAVVVAAAVVAGTVAGLVATLVCFVVVLSCAGLGLAPGVKVSIVTRFWVAFGVPYFAAFVLSVIWLRRQPDPGGMMLIYYLLAVVWATDSGAYAAGRLIGGPRLAPGISPSKTWAGLIGGMGCAFVVGWALVAFTGGHRPELAGGFGALLAVAAQAGDLFESAIKRRHKLKDSGDLIPGHGGLLDRIDGLLTAAPILGVVQWAWGATYAWW
ncbi:phosphatidate cytidylyltransferase [uncultured Gammaproteobacteria bacterium]